MCSFISNSRGQSTVEAAFLLPVFLLVLGLLAQPAIIFYDRCVMNAAAAETCRMIATSTSDASVAESYAQRKLAAIPNAAVFHQGEWQIEVEGAERAGEVSVTITNRCLRLPLTGVTSGLMGHMNADGTVEFSTTASCNATPQWVSELDEGPDSWIASWD